MGQKHRRHMVHLECVTALCDKNNLHGSDHLCGSIAAVLWGLHRLDRLPECATTGLCACFGYDNEGELLFLRQRSHAVLRALPVLGLLGILHQYLTYIWQVSVLFLGCFICTSAVVA